MNLSQTTAKAIESPIRLDAQAEPWRYNPSAWGQRVPIALLAGVGAAIAAYMGLYQVRLIDTVWDPVFGKQSMTVLDSDVSHSLRAWFGIPDAIMGSLAYLGDVIFVLAGSTRRWQFRPWLVLIFGLDVIPLGIVSAVLVFLQGYTVGAWCFLCIVTAVISLVLAALAVDEVYSCIKYLQWVRRLGGTRRECWNALLGRPSAVAHRAGLKVSKGN